MTKEILQKFKKNLLELRSNLIEDIVNHNIGIKTNIKNLGDSDLIDRSTTYSHKQFLASIITNDQKTLNEINNALIDIHSNRYGKCKICHKNIDINRLFAIPYANNCLTCKNILSKKQN